MFPTKKGAPSKFGPETEGSGPGVGWMDVSRGFLRSRSFGTKKKCLGYRSPLLGRHTVSLRFYSRHHIVFESESSGTRPSLAGPSSPSSFCSPFRLPFFQSLFPPTGPSSPFPDPLRISRLDLGFLRQSVIPSRYPLSSGFWGPPTVLGLCPRG